MAEQLLLSWGDVEERVRQLADLLPESLRHRPIYGVPRGGVPVAVLLACALDGALTAEPSGALVVDDLVDSGRTAARYPQDRFVALYAKSWAPRSYSALSTPVPRDAWVVFPWERDEPPAHDGVLRIVQAAGCDTSRPEVAAAASQLADGLEAVIRAAGGRPARTK